MTVATGARRTKLEATIAILQDMIERATTPEGERDAARRSLASLLKRLEKAERIQPGHVYERVYGENYIHDYHVTTVQIAALIRSAVKVRRAVAKKTAGAVADESAVMLALRDPIADMPAQIKVSIRSDYFSGGSSIDVGLKNLPPEWAWQQDPWYDPTDCYHSQKWIRSDALDELVKALESLVASYNHDGSDAQTDYYDVRFYSNVSVDWHEVPRD